MLEIVAAILAGLITVGAIILLAFLVAIMIRVLWIVVCLVL